MLDFWARGWGTYGNKALNYFETQLLCSEVVRFEDQTAKQLYFCVGQGNSLLFSRTVNGEQEQLFCSLFADVHIIKRKMSSVSLSALWGTD